MIVRSFKSILTISVVSVALLFLPWQAVIPVFTLAFLGYKYRNYGKWIDKGGEEASPPSVRGLLTTLGLYVGLLAATLVGTATVAPEVLAGDPVPFPALEVDNAVPILFRAGTLLALVAGEVLALLVLTYAVGRYRSRLLAGTHSRGAAIAGVLWELPVRIPVYFLWTVIFGTGIALAVLALEIVGEFFEIGFTISQFFTQLYGSGSESVLAVVLVAGHLAPLVVIGAYLVVQVWKYSDWTVPEAYGYRGLFPPEPEGSLVNVLVPVGLYLVYAVPVVALNGDLLSLSGVVAVPVLVAVALAADVRGLTSWIATSPVGRLPGIGGDAVVVGAVVGAYALVPFVALDAILWEGLDAIPRTALFYPVLVVPPSYAVNRILSWNKARTVQDLVDRVEEDPDEISESLIDRLHRYSTARDDALRAAALGGLAAAVGVTAYREREATDRFLDAVDRPTEAFARPGLRGVNAVLTARRDPETIARLSDAVTLDAIVEQLDAEEPETRAAAAEAFALVVEVGSSTPGVDRPPLEDLDAIPVQTVADIVDASGDSGDLTSAAMRGFARLWFDRDTVLSGALTTADADRILVKLFEWAPRADERARDVAAMAITSVPGQVSAGGLETVAESLAAEDWVTRFAAAVVLQSSMESHVESIDLDAILALLDDESSAVRWVAAEALLSAVDADPDAAPAVVDELLAHLADATPAAAGSAEGAVLRVLQQVPPATVLDTSLEADAAAVVARYVSVPDARLAAPAAATLAGLLDHEPAARDHRTVTGAIEAGLTHQHRPVRERCLDAVGSIVAVAPGDGRPFVRGLILNLAARDSLAGVAASCLARVHDEYPAYATEYLPETASGIRNRTEIDGRYGGARLDGKTVQEVTTTVLAEATDRSVSRGENLIDPLVDLATAGKRTTREAATRALANLSTAYPGECRVAVDVATEALEEGGVRTRRDAARLLANVAASYPESVQPVVSNLVVATDDDDHQTRATALAALGSIGANDPRALESDVRRIVGRMDDDSPLVRENAAGVIVRLAEVDPTVVSPGAETADRLRRLQRDPAVDLDDEVLQVTATAIQTGTPSSEAADGDTELWSSESVDEMGRSGDTKVFDPSSLGGFDDVDDDFPGPGEGVSDSDEALPDADDVVSPDESFDDNDGVPVDPDPDETDEGTAGDENAVPEGSDPDEPAEEADESVEEADDTDEPAEEVDEVDDPDEEADDSESDE